ncbi:MAG: Lipid A biosynthesis lauroyltransferase [Desulfovibrio sp.]
MKIPPSVVGPFIGGFYRLWCATLRYEQINRIAPDTLSKQGKPLVFALWHGEVFGFPYKKGDWEIFTIVSRSQDGEYLAHLLEDQKILPLRGSSSRGGLAALLRGAKIMRDNGTHACITVDGPRGPRHEVKDGALFLAHRAEAHIVPMRAVYSLPKVFSSWDKFQLPLPFSKVTMIFGEPYQIEAEELTDDVLAVERKKLKDAIDGLVAAKMPPQESFGTKIRRTFLFGMAKCLRQLDFAGIFRVASFLGFVMWTFLRKRRAATVERVKFHLNLSADEAAALAKSSFYNTAYSFMEIFLNDKFKMEYVTVDNPELLHRMMQPGQSGVLATAHFGSWELMGTLISQTANRPTMTVARKQKDPVVSDLIRDLRGESKLIAVDHRSAAGPTLECMRNEGIVGFLADHNTSRKEAVFLPFFNDIAAVNVGPAMLAVRAKAIVYPVFLRRDGLKAYTLHMHEPLDTTTLEGSLGERVQQVAEFYTKAIENEIRKTPEQWLWMHNRWKTRPPKDGEEPRKRKKKAKAEEGA